MKFDMSAAWNETTRLLSANRQVLLIIAGVFFFLPSLAFGLMFDQLIAPIEAAQADNPEPGVMFRAMIGVFSELWWLMLLTTIIQWFGTLGMLVLLTDPGRPTVGEALKTGAKLLLTYLGVQILVSCILGIVLLFPFAAGASAGAGAGFVVGLVAMVLLAYLFTKFLLVSPVVAAERESSPLAALGRSWRLTKGNSLRLFAFVVLLSLAFVVVAIVASIVVGLMLALAGSEIATVGDAIVSSLVTALFTAIFVTALAAIHRQLAKRAPETVGETFS